MRITIRNGLPANDDAGAIRRKRLIWGVRETQKLLDLVVATDSVWTLTTVEEHWDWLEVIGINSSADAVVRAPASNTKYVPCMRAKGIIRGPPPLPGARTTTNR